MLNLAKITGQIVWERAQQRRIKKDSGGVGTVLLETDYVVCQGEKPDLVHTDKPGRMGE